MCAVNYIQARDHLVAWNRDGRAAGRMGQGDNAELIGIDQVCESACIPEQFLSRTQVKAFPFENAIGIEEQDIPLDRVRISQRKRVIRSRESAIARRAGRAVY